MSEKTMKKTHPKLKQKWKETFYELNFFLTK